MSSPLSQVPTGSPSVFRIDRFVVPAAARDQFLGRVMATRDFLATLDGCLQNVVLEEEQTVENSRILTIVEWRDDRAFEAAKAAAAERYRAIGFKPAELIAQLGVKPEFGNYRPAA